jgi:hypothetical protein
LLYQAGTGFSPLPSTKKLEFAHSGPDLSRSTAHKNAVTKKGRSPMLFASEKERRPKTESLTAVVRCQIVHREYK